MVGAMESDLTEVLDVVEAVEFLRAMVATPEPFRDGIGMAGCDRAFFGSASAGSDAGAGFAALPLPGRGKWFRLGSAPTIVS